MMTLSQPATETSPLRGAAASPPEFNEDKFHGRSKQRPATGIA
jgi:hypothetical protein